MAWGAAEERAACAGQSRDKANRDNTSRSRLGGELLRFMSEAGSGQHHYREEIGE